MKPWILLSVILSLVGTLQSQNLTLQVSNIKNHSGCIQLMFYKTAESFDQDAPWMIKRYSKQGMKDGCLLITDSLPSGVYGIVLLDDENNSEVAEYNVLGLPKEGFGFAGYYHRGIRRPHFDDFKFNIDQKLLRMDIKIRYF